MTVPQLHSFLQKTPQVNWFDTSDWKSICYAEDILNQTNFGIQYVGHWFKPVIDANVSYYGSRPIESAVEQGVVKTVRVFLEMNPYFSVDRNKKSPLHKAVEKDKSEVALLLVMYYKTVGLLEKAINDPKKKLIDLAIDQAKSNKESFEFEKRVARDLKEHCGYQSTLTTTSEDLARKDQEMRNALTGISKLSIECRFDLYSLLKNKFQRTEELSVLFKLNQALQKEEITTYLAKRVVKHSDNKFWVEKTKQPKTRRRYYNLLNSAIYHGHLDLFLVLFQRSTLTIKGLKETYTKSLAKSLSRKPTQSKNDIAIVMGVCGLLSQEHVGQQQYLQGLTTSAASLDKLLSNDDLVKKVVSYSPALSAIVFQKINTTFQGQVKRNELINMLNQSFGRMPLPNLFEKMLCLNDDVLIVETAHLLGIEYILRGKNRKKSFVRELGFRKGDAEVSLSVHEKETLIEIQKEGLIRWEGVGFCAKVMVRGNVSVANYAFPYMLSNRWRSMDAKRFAFFLNRYFEKSGNQKGHFFADITYSLFRPDDKDPLKNVSQEALANIKLLVEKGLDRFHHYKGLGKFVSNGVHNSKTCLNDFVREYSADSSLPNSVQVTFKKISNSRE